MSSSSRSLPYDLSGHVAVVTGANHGIGAATARALAGCGAAVLLSFHRLQETPESGLPAAHARGRAQTAEALVAEIRAEGGRADAIEADLRAPETPRALFDRAEESLGPVDILVNNASGWLADSFVERERDGFGRSVARVSAQTHDAQFAVDARAAALLIAEFARRHQARGASWGRILGLTSGGPLGFPGEVSYGAAKAALENYTMSAAFELAPFGVTANIVCPPVTDTGWVTDEVRAFVERDPHLIHVARPEEVAETLAFLASDRARLVTANVIHLR